MRQNVPGNRRRVCLLLTSTGAALRAESVGENLQRGAP
jgi:hypothetical protein